MMPFLSELPNPGKLRYFTCFWGANFPSLIDLCFKLNRESRTFHSLFCTMNYLSNFSVASKFVCLSLLNSWQCMLHFHSPSYYFPFYGLQILQRLNFANDHHSIIFLYLFWFSSHMLVKIQHIQQIMLFNLDIHMQKTETRFLFLSCTKRIKMNKRFRHKTRNFVTDEKLYKEKHLKQQKQVKTS